MLLIVFLKHFLASFMAHRINIVYFMQYKLKIK